MGKRGISYTDERSVNYYIWGQFGSLNMFDDLAVLLLGIYPTEILVK